MGLAMGALGELIEAVSYLRRALKSDGGHTQARLGLSRYLMEQDKPHEALEFVSELVRREPDNAEALTLLGSVHLSEGNTDKAQAAFERTLALEDSSVEAYIGLGHLQAEAGDFDQARTWFYKAIDVDADSVGARFHIIGNEKVTVDHPQFLALAAMNTDDLPRGQQISWHYAMGKGYADLKDPAKAMDHYIKGAALKRATFEYSPDAAREVAKRIKSALSAQAIKSLMGNGNASDLPIFVLGMPRSGTTLTEQIIASHPRVHGAGELSELNEIVDAKPPNNWSQSAFPDSLFDLTPERIKKFGTQYIDRLQSYAPQAQRITDKMPGNYMLLGIIALALPGAKVVHVNRNPVDTCLSCFTRLFNRHQHATYDLHEVGQSYLNYHAMMQHWREVLPPGTFYDIRYEDVVADLPGEARKLIDFLELEWDDACLKFYENKRQVRTASLSQVRQPIYNSSVARWKPYAPYIEPLLDALGPLVPADDETRL